MTSLARAVLSLAVRMLPVEYRWRYDGEFEADLLSLPAWRRLGYALSTFATAPRLRWTLVTVMCGGHASVRCWLGRHDDRLFHPNPESRFVIAQECRRCGRVRDPRQYLPRTRPVNDLAWGGYFLDGGR